MVAVIFEVKPKIEGKEEYMKIAAGLRNFLKNRDGFISIERFQSLSEEGKVLSLSFWQDEAAIEKWRNLLEHRAAQKKGRESLFHSYRIRVAQVVRDYTESDRNEAPLDSNDVLARPDDCSVPIVDTTVLHEEAAVSAALTDELINDKSK